MIEVVFACFALVSGDALTPPQPEPAWEYFEVHSVEEMRLVEAHLRQSDKALEFNCRAYRVEKEPSA